MLKLTLTGGHSGAGSMSAGLPPAIVGNAPVAVESVFTTALFTGNIHTTTVASGSVSLGENTPFSLFRWGPNSNTTYNVALNGSTITGALTGLSVNSETSEVSFTLQQFTITTGVSNWATIANFTGYHVQVYGVYANTTSGTYAVLSDVVSTSTGLTHGHIAVFNSGGTLLWDRCISAQVYSNRGTGVVIDDLGHYITAIMDVNVASGIGVLQFDANGTLLWQTYVTPPSGAQLATTGRPIAINSNNDITVAFSYIPPNSPSYPINTCIVQLSNTGALLWAIELTNSAGTTMNYPEYLVIDDAHNTYLGVGDTQSTYIVSVGSTGLLQATILLPNTLFNIIGMAIQQTVNSSGQAETFLYVVGQTNIVSYNVTTPTAPTGVGLWYFGDDINNVVLSAFTCTGCNADATSLYVNLGQSYTLIFPTTNGSLGSGGFNIPTTNYGAPTSPLDLSPGNMFYNDNAQTTFGIVLIQSYPTVTLTNALTAITSQTPTLVPTTYTASAIISSSAIVSHAANSLVDTLPSVALGRGGLAWLSNRTTAVSNLLLTRNLGDLQVTGLNTDTLVSQLDVPGFIFEGYTEVYLTANGMFFNQSSFYGISDTTNNGVTWLFTNTDPFFQTLTYSGTGASQSVLYSATMPNVMVLIKSLNVIGDWFATMTGMGGTLTLTDGATLDTTGTAITTIDTQGQFTVGANASVTGTNYLAYIFEGSPSLNATAIASAGTVVVQNGVLGTNAVDLGWEPQFLIVKDLDNALFTNWHIIDTMRQCDTQGNAVLSASDAAVEVLSTSNLITPTSSGFIVSALSYLSGQTVQPVTLAYYAIRRAPMIPPSSGTEILASHLVTGTATITPVILPMGGSLYPDVILSLSRTTTTAPGALFVRGTGPNVVVYTDQSKTNVLNANALSSFDPMGYTLGIDSLYGASNASGTNYVHHVLRRAPNVFDVARHYINTIGSYPQSFVHNLGCVPELMLIQLESTGAPWMVYHKNFPDGLLDLSSNAVISSAAWSIHPNANVFSYTPSTPSLSAPGAVAYLFASLSGISSVGSYTGNGTTQSINCGFSNGARLVLIKRVDGAGHWYIWDTARGISSSGSPYLTLDTTMIEQTDASLTPNAYGFSVTQTANTNINIQNAIYLYLALS